MFNDNVISKKVSLSDIEENMRQLLNRIPEFKIPYIKDNVEYFEFNANRFYLNDQI